MDFLYKVGAILGLLAFCQVSAVASKLRRIERDWAGGQRLGQGGTKEDIAKVLAPCIGKEVFLDFYEDEDMDLLSVSGKNKIILLDIDPKWILVHIQTPKAQKDKLIRISSVKGVSYQE